MNSASKKWSPPSTLSTLYEHLDQHLRTVEELRAHLKVLDRWGDILSDRLTAGHRLLCAGNGGSAAEAQHLTAELVGRFDAERRPFSAISLHVDSSSVTAIGNDYGFSEIFARQVSAHGRRGDILLLFSTSGRSENLLRAARTARAMGITLYSMTGAEPNPLIELSDDAIALTGTAASVQEAHLLALHVLCRAFDARVSPTRMTEGRQ